MSRRGIGTGASTGTVRGGLVDGSPSLSSVAGACLVLMGTPTATCLWGPPWLLYAEAVPAGAVVVAAVTAYRAGARRMRADHAAAGYGIDPDASRPDHPWAVTAQPGREEELFADGLAWSVAGCPVPARELRWCAFGHPALVPAGGLLSQAARMLADRRRWQCSHGHPAAGTEAPVSFGDRRNGVPSRPAAVVPDAELAADLAVDPAALPAAPVPEPVEVAS